MKINIKATNIGLSDSVRDYAEKKIRSLEKFLNSENEILANIEIGKSTKHHKSGDIFRAEAHIKSDGKEFYSVSEKEDLYIAIDDVKEEISREINSKRKKAISMIRRGGAHIKYFMKQVGDMPGNFSRRIYRSLRDFRKKK